MTLEQHWGFEKKTESLWTGMTKNRLIGEAWTYLSLDVFLNIFHCKYILSHIASICDRLSQTACLTTYNLLKVNGDLVNQVAMAILWKCSETTGVTPVNGTTRLLTEGMLNSRTASFVFAKHFHKQKNYQSKLNWRFTWLFFWIQI